MPPGTMCYQEHYFVLQKSWWSSHLSASGLLPFLLQPLRSWGAAPTADSAAGQPVATSVNACCISAHSRMVWQRIGEHVLFRLDAPASFINCFLAQTSLLARSYLLSLFAFSALSSIAVNQDKSHLAKKKVMFPSFITFVSLSPC